MKQKIKKPLNVYAIALLCAIFIVMNVASAVAQYRSFGGGTTGGGAAAGGPNLVATTQQIQGGNLTIGSTSYVVVLFRNDGSNDVQVGNVNLYPSSTVSAAPSLNQCSGEPISPGAECAITLAVSGLQAGAYRIEVLVDHNGRTRLATASISGTVEGLSADQQTTQNELESFPNELNFGSVSSGIEQIRSVTFRNKTSAPIEISDIYLDAAARSGYSYKTNCEVLRPGSACVVTVTWSPVKRGQSLGTLILRHDGVTGLTRVDVSGDYSPAAPVDAPIYPDMLPNAGLLITDRSELDFGSNIESISAITASLVNVGDQELMLENIRLSGSENGLSVGRGGCMNGYILQPNAACPLTITWAPTRQGPIIDDVQIRHTGARGILVIPVRGDAEEAVSRDSVSLRTIDGELQNEMAPNLDGYVVTSLSQRTAVITGPIGTMIVRDGQETVIGGMPWFVVIKNTGVELQSNGETVLLVFDRSLTPNRFGNRGMSGNTTGTNTNR